MDFSWGICPYPSGVQYVILKNLAQKADFDLKIETIQENSVYGHSFVYQ